MTGEGAAGSPAARLAAYFADQTTNLGDHRSRLSQDNEDLASVLLEIEQGALEQLQRVFESGTAGLPAPDLSTESATQILRGRVGWLSQWAQRSKRSSQTETPHVVQGFVVSDEPEGDGSEKSS